MLAFIGSTVSALRLRPDEAGGWSAPVPRPAGASARRGPGVRTRLLGPGVRLRWRRAAADTVLFAHPGAEVCVRFHDFGHGRVTTILGDDPGAGHVPQYVVPAGVTHTISPAPGRFALWSEAPLGPSAADWEFPKDAWEPVLPPVLPDNRGNGTPVSGPTALRPRLTRMTRFTGPAVPGASVTLSVLTGAGAADRLHAREQDVTYLLTAGGPVHQLLLSPEGKTLERRLGPDPAAGHIPAVTVPAGWWRVNYLGPSAEGTAVSELAHGPGAVARTALRAEDILRRYPRVARELLPYAAD